MKYGCKSPFSKCLRIYFDVRSRPFISCWQRGNFFLHRWESWSVDVFKISFPLMARPQEIYYFIFPINCFKFVSGLAAAFFFTFFFSEIDKKMRKQCKGMVDNDLTPGKLIYSLQQLLHHLTSRLGEMTDRLTTYNTRVNSLPWLGHFYKHCRHSWRKQICLIFHKQDKQITGKVDRKRETAVWW